MTTAPSTSIDNKVTKVKRLKEYGFCVYCFSFVWVLFYGGFFFMFFSSLESFYHQESSHYIQIMYNNKKLLQREKTCHNFGFFFVFVTVLKK